MKNTNKIISRTLAAVMSLTVLCSGIAVASYSAGAESTGAVAAAQKTEQKADSKTAQKANGLSKTETEMENGILSRDGWAVIDESRRHIFVKDSSDVQQ